MFNQDCAIDIEKGSIDAAGQVRAYAESLGTTLEREGIEKFVASFNELLKRVADKRRHLAAAA